ncbi:hypothetical protein GW17_00033828, partial [Ensete ventricosum]
TKAFIVSVVGPSYLVTLLPLWPIMSLYFSTTPVILAVKSKHGKGGGAELGAQQRRMMVDFGVREAEHTNSEDPSVMFCCKSCAILTDLVAGSAGSRSTDAPI